MHNLKAKNRSRDNSLLESKLYNKFYRMEQLLDTDFYEMTTGRDMPHSEKIATFTVSFRRSDFAATYIDGVELAVSAIASAFPLKNSSLGSYIKSTLGNSPKANIYRKALFSRGLELDIQTVLDGTLMFPNTPVMTVTGPMWQCSLVEPIILNCLNTYSPIISTALEYVSHLNRNDRSEFTFIEMGTRRASGLATAPLAARSAFLGGFDLTSNVKASSLFDIPVAGTMHHAYIMSYPTEIEAMEAFVKESLKNESTYCTLLVDTYDPITGTKNAITIFDKYKGEKAPHTRFAIRLDDNLEDLIPICKQLLIDAGHKDVQIVASGDITPDKLETLIKLPVNVFGIGKKLVKPHKDIDFTYKLSVFDGVPKMKLTKGGSLPGYNNIIRRAGQTLDNKSTSMNVYIDVVLSQWEAEKHKDESYINFPFYDFDGNEAQRTAFEKEKKINTYGAIKILNNASEQSLYMYNNVLSPDYHRWDSYRIPSKAPEGYVVYSPSLKSIISNLKRIP